MERRRFASRCLKFGQFASVFSLTLFIFVPNPSRACRRHRPLLLLLHFHPSFFAVSSNYNRRTRERYIDAYGFRISIKVSSLEGFGLENDKIEAERNRGYGSENGRRAHAAVAFVTCEAMKPLRSHFVYWKQREADLCENSIFFITYLAHKQRNSKQWHKEDEDWWSNFEK
ncbi:hypothetical protein P8452_43670 [Trifolium repens]|nr:hypothetical protein P8452_43670 [Trifolium repens]